MTPVERALVAGRQAAAILEALPADLGNGYSDDEIAAHYAATERLLVAFRRLDAAVTGVANRNTHPHEK